MLQLRKGSQGGAGCKGERSALPHQAPRPEGTPHFQLLWSPSCNSDLPLNLCVVSKVPWDSGARAGSLEPAVSSRPPWTVGYLLPWPRAPTAAALLPHPGWTPAPGEWDPLRMLSVPSPGLGPSALEGALALGIVSFRSLERGIKQQIKKQKQTNKPQKDKRETVGKSKKRGVPRFYFALGPAN